MKIIGYRGEWTPDALATMVMHASWHCRYVVFVIAKGRQADAMELVDEIMPQLVTQRTVEAWPGTIKVGGESSEMLEFEVNQGTLEVAINRMVPAMFLPEPPVEDLSLLRADGRPFFVTITHERDAFFKLESQEFDSLASVIGSENLVDQGDDEFPEERY